MELRHAFKVFAVVSISCHAASMSPATSRENFLRPIIDSNCDLSWPSFSTCSLNCWVYSFKQRAGMFRFTACVCASLSADFTSLIETGAFWRNLLAFSIGSLACAYFFILAS